MQESEPSTQLGVSQPAPQQEALPAADSLQFDRAEPLSPDEPEKPRCVACQQILDKTYYHAQGQMVCPACAERIQAGQQAPPATSLLRAAFYGGAAAFAGFLLYAIVAIVTKLEIGLISIAVGLMVGKAIRYASGGLGGRPQQILAVALTYFAISTSSIPVAIYQWSQTPQASEQTKKDGSTTVEVAEPGERAAMSPLAAILFLLMLGLAAPFLSLSSGISGLISLAIVFFGLSQAWKLTGRSDLLLMGPYELTPGP